MVFWWVRAFHCLKSSLCWHIASWVVSHICHKHSESSRGIVWKIIVVIVIVQNVQDYYCIRHFDLKSHVLSTRDCLQCLFNRFHTSASTGHSTKHGLDWTGLDWTGRLDWTGLDSWTGLDWTVGLDWIGLILIYIFKCFAPQSFHSRKFCVQIFIGNIVMLGARMYFSLIPKALTLTHFSWSVTIPLEMISIYNCRKFFSIKLLLLIFPVKLLNPHIMRFFTSWQILENTHLYQRRV